METVSLVWMTHRQVRPKSGEQSSRRPLSTGDGEGFMVSMVTVTVALTCFCAGFPGSLRNSCWWKVLSTGLEAVCQQMEQRVPPDGVAKRPKGSGYLRRGITGSTGVQLIRALTTQASEISRWAAVTCPSQQSGTVPIPPASTLRTYLCQFDKFKQHVLLIFVFVYQKNGFFYILINFYFLPQLNICLCLFKRKRNKNVFSADCYLQS